MTVSGAGVAADPRPYPEPVTVPAGPLPPADLPGLVRALATGDPTRPRLTWYGPAGERIELSGKVLDNWVAKTANLLVDELDVGPGRRVCLDLPPHWRTAVWLLACWSAGGCAVPVRRGDGAAAAGAAGGGAPEGRVDVWVSDRPESAAARAAATGGAELVAVALPALATGFGPGLPAGAIDAAVEVRSQGDVFVPLVRPAPGDVALELPDGAMIKHADLITRARQAADRLGLPPGIRLFTGAGPQDCVPGLLAPLIRDGSVVLHHDPAGLAPGSLDHLLAQEQATRL